MEDEVTRELLVILQGALTERCRVWQEDPLPWPTGPGYFSHDSGCDFQCPHPLAAFFWPLSCVLRVRLTMNWYSNWPAQSRMRDGFALFLMQLCLEFKAAERAFSYYRFSHKLKSFFFSCEILYRHTSATQCNNLLLEKPLELVSMNKLGINKT